MSSEETIVNGPAGSGNQYPLSLIFSSGGSMLTNPYGYYPCEIDQELQFTRNFKVKPFTFIHQLQNLEKRCFDNDVIFTPLKLTDSVDETAAKIRSTLMYHLFCLLLHFQVPLQIQRYSATTITTESPARAHQIVERTCINVSL